VRAKRLHSNLGNLVLWTKSDLDDFAGKADEWIWSTGVLEFWSVGKSQSQNFNMNNDYSITPPLNYSSGLPNEGMTPK
jgi:hypothetical protein